MPPDRPSAELLAWRARFGRRLRELRIEQGMTQERVAELAGVDRKLVYRTELGQTSPRLDAVVMIAQALRVELAVLVTDRPASG